MKKHRKAKIFLEELRLVPIVSSASGKTGLSRNTIYRWRKEDPDFATVMDEALNNGVSSINDLAESKLVIKIKEGDFPAIKYWLDNHKKEYMRPRPKNFLENFNDDKITGISISIVKTREEADSIDPEQGPAEVQEAIS